MTRVRVLTFTGRLVDLLDPQLDDLDIEDIAHALAQINRFGGHTRRPYSVAEHCIVGSYFVAPEYALEFLLHDASEAYLGDVSSPLKGLLGRAYLELELRFAARINRKFGLPMRALPPEVERVDRLLLACEFDVLMGRKPDGAKDNEAHKVCWRLREKPPRFLKHAFLDRFHELMVARYRLLNHHRLKRWRRDPRARPHAACTTLHHTAPLVGEGRHERSDGD